jgi:hypothetical protein
VVLKKIRRELLSDAVAVERFRREACAAAAIHHQNVVAVYDAFQWCNDLFLLGILLYEMIAGVPPFRESTDQSTDTLLQRMQNRQFTPLRKLAPQAPRWIARLVRSCLKSRPAQRMESTTAVRRYLEHRLGNHSPADCRRRIAIYMRERGVLDPLQERTAVRPSRPRRKPTGLRHDLIAWFPAMPPAAWRGGAMAALLLAAMFATFWMLRPEATLETRATQEATAGTRQPSRSNPPLVASLEIDPELAFANDPTPAGGINSQADGPAIPAKSVAPVPQPPADPAHLRFVAHPWAEVTIDDGPAFLTPRAQPLELAPGPHRVVFTHPTYGQAVVSLDVQPGEERVVSHVFEDADSR